MLDLSSPKALLDRHVRSMVFASECQGEGLMGLCEDRGPAFLRVPWYRCDLMYVVCGASWGYTQAEIGLKRKQQESHHVGGSPLLTPTLDLFGCRTAPLHQVLRRILARTGARPADLHSKPSRKLLKAAGRSAQIRRDMNAVLLLVRCLTPAPKHSLPAPCEFRRKSEKHRATRKHRKLRPGYQAMKYWSSLPLRTK